MSEDRLPEELTVLLRACERGDTRAPIQMLQCCITGMTLFKHSLPAAGRRALLDAMHELTLGVQFILAGDAEAEEEARVLKASVEQIQTEIEEMKRRRDDLGNALGLCRTERYSLQQELDWLTALREHADFRARIAEGLPDRKAYLNVLRTMSSRAAGQEKLLKDLEQECVSILGTIEQALKEHLKEEEEAWQTRERRVLEGPRHQA